MLQQVILVDENNNHIGTEEKIKAHREGKLHRAFSIFVFNSKNQLLIQQRAKAKYHFPGIWANTTCSHPNPDETYEKAIHRRLKEEMGFDCKLEKAFSFIYKAESKNCLKEHEHDTIFIGKFDGKIFPNKKEVMDYKWINISHLKKEIAKNPDDYTPWLKLSLEKMKL